MTTNPRNLLSLGAVGVGAAALGMVLAGGLGITPAGNAREAADTPVRKTATPAAAPSVMGGYPDFATLAERVNASVISVFTTDVVKPSEMRRYHRDVDPFEFFFGPQGPQGRPNQPPTRQGAGSGFFISEDGLAVTNNHVVEGADKIQVLLADSGSRLDAKVVGRDPATDIALIKVEGKGPFVPLPLGDSERLRVGEWVMAVGNPLNMDHTVTVGVVSAKGRQLGLSDQTSSFENFIQTDAAINLGNSGGPLVNVRGEVVGINTAINAAGQNLGFAVPVNTAKMVIPQLKDKGKVTRGYLGVNITNVTDETKEAFNLASNEGAFVQEVVKGGPADKAGLAKGDAIIAVNGSPVKDNRQLIDKVAALSPGSKVELDVVRDGKRKAFTATLSERPGTVESAEAETGEPQNATAKLGLEVEDLSTRSRRSFEIPKDLEGVVITGVDELSAADDAGLRVGDVITEVNGQEITTVDELRSAMEKVRSGQRVRLYVYRPQADRSTYLTPRMP